MSRTGIITSYLILRYVVRSGFIDIYLNRNVPPFCQTWFRLPISENVAVPQSVDHCSHWLDCAATPRQEARNLFALVGTRGVTVESIRELITVPPDIERTLQLYLRRPSRGRARN